MFTYVSYYGTTLLLLVLCMNRQYELIHSKNIGGKIRHKIILTFKILYSKWIYLQMYYSTKSKYKVHDNCSDTKKD